MYDLVSIGNISLDTFYEGESLTHEKERFQLALGGKYFVERAVQTIGGGGANVAIGVARHNFKAAVLGTVGNNPFKKMVLAWLTEERVSTDLIHFEDEYMNVSAILLTEGGEKTVIHYTSPHRNLIRSVSANVFRSKCVYLGNLPDVSIYEKTRFLEKLKFLNVKCIVNLGVKDCRLPKSALKPFLELVDVLVLNGHEFAELVKAPYRDIHFKDDIVGWYVPVLRDNLVVVTEGEKGSFAYFNGNVHHERAPEVKRIVDTTGAGDAYTAGFIAGFLGQDDVRQAMVSGTKYAGKILGKIGAS